MVLAGKLDPALARQYPRAASTADFRARYLDAGTRLALPAPRPSPARTSDDRRRADPQRTAAVDIDASPPDGEPVALVLFGTNQAAPAQIAAARYHAGTAPLVIATGGVNRHTGIIEGREFARQLTRAGVPGGVIRVEDQSEDTWQNVELSLPHLREALALGLRLAVVSKWYHLRTIYCLATQLPKPPRSTPSPGNRSTQAPWSPGPAGPRSPTAPPGAPRIPGSPPPRRRRNLPRRPQS